MRYTRLGDTGLVVSRLAFGAMTFLGGDRTQTAVNKVGQALAEDLVARSCDAGVNFFDTADVYDGGHSEEMLGRALRSRRNDVVLATKVGVRTGEVLSKGGLSRRHILMSIDESLQRLGTDWVDVYIAHKPDPFTPLEETLSALDAVVRSGKARYLGFSNWPAWQAATAIEMQKANGLARFTHGQMYYSLLGRDIEHEVMPMMAHHGLGLTVWSPLAFGFLSGKFTRETLREDGSRFAKNDVLGFDKDAGFALLDRLQAIGRDKGAPVAQIALAWLLAQPGVSSVVMGVSKVDQLVQNLDAIALELTPDELAMLDDWTRPADTYPGWFVKRQIDQRIVGALA